MALLARRNLLHDRIRFAVTLTGIVFALVLIIVVFLGQKLPLGLRVDAYVQARAIPERH